ncbi:amino acid ABC transporter substrate-binding protein (PAAT family) [Microterricola gilva]|uniref:Amino acid ABC transporter substrate-binding protein (PAAT family) n=1 Tax=Microterricola gilva TaxID=393267 RepID=A0A4Q8AMY8_9MICO|nr:transporter substrate-binding domain-containing protein [Microterricola gilva]RZU65393.1 amino acid ABC transporter substrate-binding protein (PAAT family) [Microterricola gilva]
MRHHAKTLLGISAMAVLAASMTACSSEAPATATGADAGPAGLHTAGVLNDCVALSYEPLEYYENGTSGEVIGWDVEAAREVGKLLGVETEVNVMDFDGLIPGLQSGKCDIAWSGMYINDKRVQVADAVPVLQTGSQVVLRNDVAETVTETMDLCGLRLAAQTGTEDESHVQDVSAECTAAGKPEIIITGYPGSVDAIPAIRSGKLDGLVDTTVLAATLGKKNDDLTPVPGLFPADYWFGAFTDKGSELSPEIEKAIHTLIENGTLAKLAEKYGLNPDDVAKVDTKAL